MARGRPKGPEKKRTSMHIPLVQKKLVQAFCRANNMSMSSFYERAGNLVLMYIKIGKKGPISLLLLNAGIEIEEVQKIMSKV